MRFAAAGLVVFLGLSLVPQPRTAARVGGSERRVTLRPGYCSDSAGWYEVDSTDTTVTVACYDEDPHQEEPSHDDDSDPGVSNAGISTASH